MTLVELQLDLAVPSLDLFGTIRDDGKNIAIKKRLQQIDIIRYLIEHVNVSSGSQNVMWPKVK